MRRSDQATYVPRPEQVILEATAQSQSLARWPKGAKQQSRNAKTRDPPSQDPGDRIPKPCRHNKHQCTSNASICRALWKEMRVKRTWNECETYRVKRKQQQHLQASVWKFVSFRGYNLALVRLDLHWAVSGETGLWEGVCNRRKWLW